MKTTRPLPEGFVIETGPNGNEYVSYTPEPGTYYSAAAWEQIELGNGLWRDAHKAIFGQ